MTAALILAAICAVCLWLKMRHSCKHQDPLCTRHRPCVACWRAGVLKAQEGLAAPKVTMPRVKVKVPKPVFIRRQA